ncbi:MAG: hypothetical protein ACXWB2_19045 [Acidimicrobiales bacterium]
MAVLVVAALALGACSSSKSDGAAPAGTSNEKASESSGTSSTTAGSTMTPEFSKGLAALWSDADGTDVAVLPAGLDACVYDKLPASDITVISAMKEPADSTNIDDALGIRVFRASNTCDRPGVAKMFSGQLGLEQFGITPTDAQNQCVATGVIDGVVALDPDAATGSVGEALKGPLGDALQACVPIRDFLLGVLAKEGTVSPSVAACVADKAAATVTWAEVLNDDPSLKAEGEAAGRACASATGT